MAQSAEGTTSTHSAPAAQASPARPAPPAPPALSTKQLTGIIGALALGAFLMILNETVLTVALPSIMADYDVTAETGQWLTTGFLLTMAVVIPLTGYLIQRFTLRSLFVFALSSFLVGILLAIVAPGFSVLLLARIIQAIGTAIVLPLLMSTTLSTRPSPAPGNGHGSELDRDRSGPRDRPDCVGHHRQFAVVALDLRCDGYHWPQSS